MTPYATPSALRAALTDRARKQAAATGARPDDLIRRFYFARLMARVFHADPHGWLLKGGQALLVRWNKARHSKDIDLCRPDERELAAAADALVGAVVADLGDHLRFALRRRSVRTEGTATAQLSFDVYLGVRNVDSVTVDLVAGRHPVGEPERRPLEPAVPLEWPTDWPEVLLYPLVDHVADKICAMYERHHGGTVSSRHRDLVDLVLVALREPLDGRLTQVALRAETSRRKGIGTVLVIPGRFEVPGPGWAEGYRSAAAGVPGLDDHRSLDQAAALADAFLSPILAADDPGVWNPGRGRWATR